MRRLLGFVPLTFLLVLACAGVSEAQIGRKGEDPNGGPGCTGQPVNGSITAGDPTQNGRVFRDGVPDTCAVADPCTTIAGTYHYRAQSFHNFAPTTSCVTLNETTTCTTNFIYTVAYVPAIIGATPCVGDVGSVGGSPNPTGTMSFNVPAGSDFDIVHSEVVANSGCASFDFTLTGCPATPVELLGVSVE